MGSELSTVRSVITRFYPSWRRGRKVRADVLRAATRITHCRTAELGAHVERCQCGHITNIKYNSCRHRSCPQCQGGKRAGWLERITRQLLPCEHVHVIFTIPEELNIFWQFNRRTFADLLMKAARHSLEKLLADPEHLGAKPGIISVLHTWGRNLSVHPHVHCLVTAGGMNADGCFVRSRKSILVPGRMLKAVFRGMFCDFLKRAVCSGELAIPARLTAAKAVSLFNRLGRSDWNTRIQEKYDHGVSVAGYLARYVCGSPISGRRIERVSHDAVAFRYRDHRDGQQKFMQLKPHDFLNRWFEHVPPRGLRMIRRSGLYANCCAEVRSRICEQLSETESSEIPRQAANRVTSLDPERCPLCNTEVVVSFRWHPKVNKFLTQQTPVSLARPP